MILNVPKHAHVQWGAACMQALCHFFQLCHDVRRACPRNVCGIAVVGRVKGHGQLPVLPHGVHIGAQFVQQTIGLIKSEYDSMVIEITENRVNSLDECKMNANLLHFTWVIFKVYKMQHSASWFRPHVTLQNLCLHPAQITFLL